MKDKELRDILNKLTLRLSEVYKDKLKSVILYGSVARGTSTSDSDIDIMLLIDATAEQLKSYEDKLSDVSTDFALEYFKVFSIVDVSYTEFCEWKQVLPFYKNVEREGVVLYAA